MSRISELAELARRAAGRDPCLRTATAIPGLGIWRSTERTAPEPALFEPKFYLVLQGTKRLAIGGRIIDFAPGDCAVSALGIPFHTNVTGASPVEPYVGLGLDLDLGVIAGLVLDLPEAEPGEKPPAFATARADDAIMDAAGRLLRLLDCPCDIATLAPMIRRELFYRVLRGPMGPTLRQAIPGGTRLQQIRNAAEWICRNADRPLRVAALAASSGMSVTSFHRHFKAVTAYSPLAYQRHIRLLDARRLIASGEGNVTAAAYASGYASASQFSREYKRMFGVPPVRDAVSARVG